MAVTTLSSRAFNQDTGSAKRAAQNGPVFITDRGRPAHVLLTIEAYRALSGERATLGDLLSQPDGIGDTDFEPPRLQGPIWREPDLS